VSDIFHKGFRNVGLFRNACKIRAKGGDEETILSALRELNVKSCRPALAEAEVRRIAHSAAKYPVGGSHDPLAEAWHTIRNFQGSRYERFLWLAGALAAKRLHDGEVFLPLLRIAKFMEVDWTAVRNYRKRAIAEGLLEPHTPYVAHRRAAGFLLSPKCEQFLASYPTKPPRLNTTSGPSGIPPLSSGIPKCEKQKSVSGTSYVRAATAPSCLITRPAAPANSSLSMRARDRAEADPVVQRLKQKFGARVVTAIDRKETA
jgi:hypothetical protein